MKPLDASHMHCSNGSSLVDSADTAWLMLSVAIEGDQHGPPTYCRLLVSASREHPAARITVVRKEGETCQQLWQRVLDGVRTLKRPRGIMTQVLVFCRVTTPPAEAEARDRKWNIQRALEFDVDVTNQRNPARRLEALDLLHQLVDYRGPLPNVDPVQ